jgi:hypothetical protein
MKSETIAAVRRYHDLALAAIAVRFEVPMEEVRAAVFEESVGQPAGSSELVTPSSDERVTGEGVADALPANLPEAANEKVGGVASACSALAAGSEIPERRELDENAIANGVTVGSDESGTAVESQANAESADIAEAPKGAIPPAEAEPASRLAGGRTPAADEGDAHASSATNTPGRSGKARKAPGGSAPRKSIAGLSEDQRLSSASELVAQSAPSAVQQDGAQPAAHTIPPETANEAGGSIPLADRDLVKRGFEPRPAKLAKGGPTGMGRSGRERLPTDVSISAAADGAPEAAAPNLKLVDRIRMVLAENQNATARQIGDEIGVHQKFVNAAAKAAGIELFRLSPEDLLKSRRNGTKGVPSIPAPQPEADVVEPAPEAAPAPVEPPPSSEYQPVIIKRPRGVRFRLRQGNGEGKYLHMSGTGLVPGKSWAWIGTEAQLLAIRQKFPEAQELREEVVGPETPNRS